MPIQNKNYVSPVWVDGGEPSIDQEELNDVTKTLEGSQTLLGTGDPTASTKGRLGQFYLREDGGNLWQCVGQSGGSYTWKNRDGQRPELRVLVGSGVTATLTNGVKTQSAVGGSDGMAVLFPPDFGLWTVAATISGAQRTKTIDINAVAIFYLAMSTLEEIGWTQVDAISEGGFGRYLFSVGDKKTFLLNGVSYTSLIAGFDHDNKTGGGKAGFSFQMENCLNTTYPMNDSGTNSGGWRTSKMRTSTMVTLFNQLSADLKAVIKAVDKVTSKGNQSSALETTSDKLFLYSEVEIFGSTQYSYPGEGSQYELYKAGNSTIKKVGSSASAWWERSPSGNTTAFCRVNSDGIADYYSASNSNGVSLGFCV